MTASPRRLRKALIGALPILVALCASRSTAQPVTDQFISNAQVTASKDCALLQVNFNVRLRYAGHFPVERGEELRITLLAIDRDVTDMIRLSRREGVRVDNAALAAISSVAVDLDQAGGPVLRIQFQRAVAYKVAQIGNFESIAVAISLKGATAVCKFGDFGLRQGTLTVTPSIADAPGVMGPSLRAKEKGMAKATDEDMKSIEAWMDEARAAIKKSNYSEAIQLLKKVLRYAENKYSAEAQELAGVALQKSGQAAQARAEYEDYLRRYKTGEGSERVKQRLSAILTAEGAGPERLQPSPQQVAEKRRQDKSKGDGETQWSLSSSVSTFYIRDDSFNTVKDISTAPNPNADPDEHRVHQQTFLSNLDVFGTATNDQTKSRFKFAGTEEHRLDPTGDKWGVSSAFFETVFKDSDLMFRLGRQSRNTGGVIGRFDGGVVSWQASDAVRLNVLAGSPNWSRFDLPFKDEKYLFGTSADFGKVFGVETSLFAIQQNDGGMIDRRAVGAEFRYFDKNKSALGTIDYDIHFQRLNAAIFSGTWTLEDNSIVTTGLDYRRVPYLTSWNALQGQPFLTLYDMLRFNTADEIKQFAVDRTPVFESAMVSYSRPLNEKLQVSADATVTYLSGTAPSGGVDGTPASGTEYYLSGQLTGASILKTGDMFIGAVRYADLADSNVYVFDLNTRFPVTDAFRISPRLRLGYRTGKTTDLKESTILPSVLMNYMWTPDFGLEAEIGTKWMTSEQSGVKTNTTDLFMTLGVRYDFHAEGRSKCATAPGACVWMPRALPPNNESLPYYKSAPAITSAFATEGGLRYWYSNGRNRYDYFADTTSALIVSRLNYTDLAAHAGESFFRIDGLRGPLTNVFLKGYIGGGVIAGGHLYDEDVPPVVDPYSQTASDTKGKLRYGAVDLGYNIFTNDRLRLGAFLGFHYWFETVDARGCSQIGGNPFICAAPLSSSLTVINEEDRWKSFRAGGVLDVKIMDRLKLNAELAFTGTSHRAVDTHFFTFGSDPAGGRGTGVQAESVLTYDVTENFRIGLGGRWWHFNTNAVDAFGQLLKYSTDRYGVFVQSSYRFF